MEEKKEEKVRRSRRGKERKVKWRIEKEREEGVESGVERKKGRWKQVEGGERKEGGVCV